MSTHTHPNDGTKLQLNFLITKYFSHQFRMKNPRGIYRADSLISDTGRYAAAGLTLKAHQAR